MKKSSSVGRSGTTPFKQTDLQQLISSQMDKAFKVYSKHKNKSWYSEEDNYFFDCSAGDMGTNQITSPEIFLDSLCNHQNLPSKLYLIEQKKKTFNLLENNYNNRWEKGISLIAPNTKVILKNKNMEDVLFNLAPNKYRFGLLYFDPNGFTLDNYCAISVFLKNNPKIDVVLNINISKLSALRQIKKAKGFEKYNNYYLTTLFSDLHKNSIWIRNNIHINSIKDHSKYEFVMVFGTNMDYYNIGPMPHFYDINSIEGQRLVYKYNYTKKEKELLLYNDTLFGKEEIQNGR